MKTWKWNVSPILFRDGIRESGVVTKKFDVQVVETDRSPSDEHENKFMYELQQEKKVEKPYFSLKNSM